MIILYTIIKYKIMKIIKDKNISVKQLLDVVSEDMLKAIALVHDKKIQI